MPPSIVCMVYVLSPERPQDVLGKMFDRLGQICIKPSVVTELLMGAPVSHDNLYAKYFFKQKVDVRVRSSCI